MYTVILAFRANAVAWVLWALWLINETMLDCVSWIGCSPPVRATPAWHPVEWFWEETASSGPRYSLEFQSTVLRCTSAGLKTEMVFPGICIIRFDLPSTQQRKSGKLKVI